MAYFRWQDIVKYLGSSLVSLALLLAGILNLSGISYSHDGDKICTDCYSEIKVNSTFWEVKVEHAGDKPVVFKKMNTSRTLWVNLDKIKDLVETNPPIEAEILVSTIKSYATINHKDYGYLRPLKNGDTLIYRNNANRRSPSRIIIHGIKPSDLEVKWSFLMENILMKNINIDPTWLPLSPNLADQIDNKVKTEYPFAVEVLEKRTENGKIYDLGEGRFLLKTSISKVHYKDEQGKFQNIDLTQKNSDILGFDKLIDTAPYKLYISDKGDRRIYPDRNKPEYISLPSPAFLNKAGKWVSNRELEWTNPNYNVSLLLAEDRIKFLAVIKKSVPFNSFSFPVQENGARLLDYLGGLQYWDSSAEPIVRDLGIDYQNGVLTLSWDLSGMIYPIYVDPTFSVGESADDVYTMGSTFSITSLLFKGGIDGGYDQNDAARFLNMGIPQGSTINSAFLTLVSATNHAEVVVNTNLSLENVDNAAQITSVADFDSRKLTEAVAWNNLPAWTAGTSYNTPSLVVPLQAVINRAGWSDNNAINVFWKNYGSTGGANRRGASWDNTDYAAPALTVTWTAGDTTAPSGNLTTITNNSVYNSTKILMGLKGNETGTYRFISNKSSDNFLINGTYTGVSAGTNITHLFNASNGTYIIYGNITDASSNTGETPFFVLTIANNTGVEAPPTDICTCPASGDFRICDGSICNSTTSCDIVDNDLIVCDKSGLYLHDGVTMKATRCFFEAISPKTFNMADTAKLKCGK